MTVELAEPGEANRSHDGVDRQDRGALVVASMLGVAVVGLIVSAVLTATFYLGLNYGASIRERLFYILSDLSNAVLRIPGGQ